MLGNDVISLHMHLTVMKAQFNVYVYVTAIAHQTVPLTERVVVVLKLQRHVKISTSFDKI